MVLQVLPEFQAAQVPPVHKVTQVVLQEPQVSLDLMVAQVPPVYKV